MSPNIVCICTLKLKKNCTNMHLFHHSKGTHRPDPEILSLIYRYRKWFLLYFFSNLTLNNFKHNVFYLPKHIGGLWISYVKKNNNFWPSALKNRGKKPKTRYYMYSETKIRTACCFFLSSQQFKTQNYSVWNRKATNHHIWEAETCQFEGCFALIFK